MGKTRWRQIGDLYYEALDCSPAKRSAFLRLEGVNDTELFAEITSFLTSLEKSGYFLAESHFPFAFRLINKKKRSFHIDNGFGKYNTLKFLGSSSRIGEVYLAQDSTLKFKVALRLLPVNITDETRGFSFH